MVQWSSPFLPDDIQFSILLITFHARIKLVPVFLKAAYSWLSALQYFGIFGWADFDQLSFVLLLTFTCDRRRLSHSINGSRIRVIRIRIKTPLIFLVSFWITVKRIQMNRVKNDFVLPRKLLWRLGLVNYGSRNWQVSKKKLQLNGRILGMASSKECSNWNIISNNGRQHNGRDNVNTSLRWRSWLLFQLRTSWRSLNQTKYTVNIFL